MADRMDCFLHPGHDAVSGAEKAADRKHSGRCNPAYHEKRKKVDLNRSQYKKGKPGALEIKVAPAFRHLQSFL